PPPPLPPPAADAATEVRTVDLPKPARRWILVAVAGLLGIGAIAAGAAYVVRRANVKPADVASASATMASAPPAATSAPAPPPSSVAPSQTPAPTVRPRPKPSTTVVRV